MMYKHELFFFLKVGSAGALLKFWDLWFYSLHQILKKFDHYFFKNFFSLPLFGFIQPVSIEHQLCTRYRAGLVSTVVWREGRADSTGEELGIPLQVPLLMVCLCLPCGPGQHSFKKC